MIVVGGRKKSKLRLTPPPPTRMIDLYELNSPE